MTVTIRTEATYDPSLPFYTPAPVDPSGLLWRHSAATLKLGDTAAWASDAGATSKILTCGTPGARPTAILDTNGRPVLRFDGANDYLLGSPVSLPNTLTIYAVLTPNSISTFQVLLNLAGAGIAIASSGVLRLFGTGGAPAQGSQALQSGQKVALAAWISGTSEAGVQTSAETVTSTPTIGTLAGYDLGQSGGANWLNATVNEISCYSTVHTPIQRAAQLAALRDWYAAA